MSTNLALGLLAEMAVFARVVETGSFSEAARQLASTPSAISRAVARLEKALGTRLLQRTTRKLRLSESGKEVLAHCQEMVAAAQAALDVSGQLSDEPAGLIRVSVPKAVGRFVLHPHIPEFLARHPKVDVLMRLEDRTVDLIDGDIDLAIRITDQPPPGLKGRRLLEIDHLLCATPRYLAEQGTPAHPHDLKEHNCIYLGEEPGDSRWKFRQGSKQITVQVHGRYAANHTGVRLDATLQHLGIASLPYFTARHALQQGLIVQVLPDWSFRTNYSGAAWILYPPTRHLPPKLRVFIDFLAERLRREPTLNRLGGGMADGYEVPEAGLREGYAG
ncbi:MAG: transcriptional regulator [Candidatus Dactylopiibacterium carminicum]|uniref:Transcriptional regulator n=1 Tax=Candidatus Dactylopiibacterium carminicum TaxID=857335 RepID=A0A272EQ83_9RHOO|nr:LysR family transcriptional regulator [Candidatus Dactylopiibacterium carminicum]KAF7598507.1 LysR family transcriptional regulator [Candidatus Dactylopiibacterium carminicum]PAS92262.1 MAG: transcriptional regulator [Candidatus Dactylopiibacterium carminicum]PAS95776.1 MAG: transcriptional regulator [Candidatus Dactylopiibacterium carminicum]PAS97994.1 MAG: transcriptional regulator [Candidatus Dactylopiibacterium carminicum]